MKNERFVLLLNNHKIPSYITLGYIFTFINVVAFVLFLFFPQYLWVGVAGLSTTLLYFIIRIIMVKRKLHSYLIDDAIFFLFAAIWLWKSIPVAILILIMAFLFKISLQPFRFIVTHEGIYKDFFPKKMFLWTDFNQVILKDGLITMDFTNNRLIQSPLQNAQMVDEEKFNQFAQGRLKI